MTEWSHTVCNIHRPLSQLHARRLPSATRPNLQTVSSWPGLQFHRALSSVLRSLNQTWRSWEFPKSLLVVSQCRHQFPPPHLSTKLHGVTTKKLAQSGSLSTKLHGVTATRTWEFCTLSSCGFSCRS